MTAPYYRQHLQVKSAVTMGRRGRGSLWTLFSSCNQMCEDSILNLKCMQNVVWYGFLWSLTAFCKRKKKTQHQKKSVCRKKKRWRDFSAKAIFQEGTTFLQHDPCLESPPESNIDRCSSAKCSCWLLKMHLCFKVLLTELHWTHFKQL